MSVRVANTTWPASWRSVKPNTGSSSGARNRTSITTRAGAPCASADTRSPLASSNQAAVISASDWSPYRVPSVVSWTNRPKLISL